MTKVVQSTIAERQTSAAAANLNLESQVFRQRTGLFDTGDVQAMANITPYTPLEFGSAADRSSVIASAKIPTVVGLTHQSSQKGRFVGPQIAYSAKDFRAGTSEDKEGLFHKDGTPNLYYRVYKEGLADWLLGIPAITSAGHWGDKEKFNQNRLQYWERTVPLVTADELSPGLISGEDVITNMYSTESIPFAGRGKATAGYGMDSENVLVNNLNAPVMLDAALPIGIRQFATDEIATNYMANNKNRVVLGFTISSTALKVFFTPAAIDMVVRRFNSIYQLFGTMNPRLSYLGRGHLRTAQEDPNDPQGYELYKPPTSVEEARGSKPYLVEPNLKWSCGAVPHSTKQLPANGPIYIDPNQFAYQNRKKFAKYNHTMTQLGLSLLETMSAFGLGLDENMIPMNAPFADDDASSQVAMLQMMFASLYGTTEITSLGSGDFDFTEMKGASNAHARMAEIFSMFFNKGHSHIDAGCLVYQNSLSDDSGRSALFEALRLLTSDETLMDEASTGITGFDNAAGLLDALDKRYTLCDMRVSAKLLVYEAVGRLFTFSTMASALSSYMTVPTVYANFEYMNNVARETVTEVLRYAHRPQLYADGGSQNIPFTFIDSRITDEAVMRVPCYLRDTNANRKYFNTYIGMSTPDLLGTVTDKVSEGGTCITMIEGDDIQFTPIVRGTSGTLQTKRKGMSITIINCERPEYYEPGVSRLGGIAGLMTDNSSVGGDYMIQPGDGPSHDPRVVRTIFRALAGGSSPRLFSIINPFDNQDAINRQTKFFEQMGMKPWRNFTYIPVDSNGNIDWEKWQLMYKEAGIVIDKETWEEGIRQNVNLSRNMALYPPVRLPDHTMSEADPKDG